MCALHRLKPAANLQDHYLVHKGVTAASGGYKVHDKHYRTLYQSLLHSLTGADTLFTS